jgi:2-oxoacid:acceptor oxidoreductase delta subunit (pyruvate/2-ketoisovalerate family)
MKMAKKKYWKWKEIETHKSIDDLPPVPLSLPNYGSLGATGDWRTFRPVIDKEKCNKCYICWMYCPEAVIDVDEEGFPVIDYDYCKGCLICVTECPKQAIAQIREKEESLGEGEPGNGI